jgi:hypothetical protein
MLMVAPQIVPALSWPALLVGLVVCIKIYWAALLWRGRAEPNVDPTSANNSSAKHSETVKHGRS